MINFALLAPDIGQISGAILGEYSCVEFVYCLFFYDGGRRITTPERMIGVNGVLFPPGNVRQGVFGRPTAGHICRYHLLIANLGQRGFELLAAGTDLSQ